MDSNSARSKHLIEMCGGYGKAVDVLMSFKRALWDITIESTSGISIDRIDDVNYRIINKEVLMQKLETVPPSTSELIIKLLGDKRQNNKPVFFEGADSHVGYTPDLFRPFSLVRTLLEGIRPDQDLRYFVMRNLRQHYKRPMSSNTVHLLHLLSDEVNSIYLRLKLASKSKQSNPHVLDFRRDFYGHLFQALLEDPLGSTDPESSLKLFIECSREVGYIRAHYHRLGTIDLRTTNFDATYIISNLYGLPTGIRGFDDLFGGGGLLLAEDLEETNEKGLDGRTILVKGRFGTGKSLLSLQLAAEVARKGGLAWLMPLEQSAEECLYTLENNNAIPKDQSVVIATNSLSAREVLNRGNDGHGAIIILNTIKDSFDDFLIALGDNAKEMQSYPLRLLCVDPVNSVYREKKDEVLLRAQMLETLTGIERSGTNVLLVAEEGDNSQNELLFEQNIADIVIRLSVEKKHGYASRIFEIMKSRLQREQRGEHPFSIVSGEGITLYPSSASVNARIRPRSIREKKIEVKYGLPSLDDLLGEGAIASGDVIAFQGTGGSYKTQLGLLFLFGSDFRSVDRSLLVAARDTEATLQHMLDQDFVMRVSRVKGRKQRENIRVSELPRGHVFPGLVIQRLEDEFLKSHQDGQWIDRVMIDNVAHWEMSSPFIREDETFGDTLLDFLRRERCTSLLVCGEITSDSNSVVQRSIIDGADCVIQFDRFEFRGVRRVMIRILKTRGMKHRRESFELVFSPQGIEVKPSSSLIRVLRSGEITTVKVRLFFHAKNEVQDQYNNRLVESIKSVLTEHTEIDKQDRIYMSSAKNFSGSSAVDELQILQIDEYQVPDIAELAENSLLYKYSESQWDNEVWGDFIPRYVDRIRTHRGSFFAIPYYANISLLAYRSNALGEESISSWENLVTACDSWEIKHPELDSIFFDFPKGSTENYNCLFFEILLSMIPSFSRVGHCHLLNFLRQPEAIEASKIFWRLCRRAYVASGKTDVVVRQLQKDADPVQVNNSAVVWRHWHTTLHQMLSKLAVSDRENIKVGPLPGGVSTAGEWYCGVTAYSAAPDVGLEIVKLLTTREAELDRLEAGVGLPTRKSFYEDNNADESAEVLISPYISMNMRTLRGLVYDGFRRSDIGCYLQFSNILAHHLQRILDIPDDESNIGEAIKKVFTSLERRFHFIRPTMKCNKCSWNQ